MKKKSVIFGVIFALILSVMSCNNATTAGDTDLENQYGLTLEENNKLRSEGEDIDGILNGTRSFSNSTNKQSAHGLISSFFNSYYKETYVNVNGTNKRFSYIAMKGEGTSDTPAHFSTSEATGYGMRLAIYGYKGFGSPTSQGMWNARNQYKIKFDRLWETQHMFPTVADSWGTGKPKGLHSWIIPTSGKYSERSTAATDGDLDMAYALLEAHKLWGSNGSINYQIEAYNIIAAIAHNLTNTATVNGKSITFLTVGDWAPFTDWAKNHSRPCDWMLHHFRTFEKFLLDAGFTSDDGTVQIYKKLISSAEYLFEINPWGSWILPDFVQFKNGQMILSSSEFNTAMGEDVEYDKYSWNSCRIPWRLGMDVVQNGRMASKVSLAHMYWTTRWGSTIEDTGSCYALDGTITNNNFESAFAGPIVTSLVGRMSFIRSYGEYNYFKAKRESAIAQLSTQFSGDPDWGYFGDAILAFSMIVLENKPEVISSPY